MTSSGSADAATAVPRALRDARSTSTDATHTPACRAEQDAAACYHCGQPLPARARFETVIGGSPRAMCCAGCSAVAQAIVDNGLVDYYARRDRFPDSPREAMPAVVADHFQLVSK